MLRLVAITLALVCLGACGEGFRNYETDAGDAGFGLDAGEGLQPQLPSDDREPNRDDGATYCPLVQCNTSTDYRDCDGDRVPNSFENEIGTDPCAFDTDGDGISDLDELTFHYDPTKADTYGDGTLDGDRWFFNACQNESLEPAPTRTVEAEDGTWRLEIAEDWTFERPVEPPGSTGIGELVGALQTSRATARFVSWISDEEVGDVVAYAVPPGVETDTREYRRYNFTASSVVFDLQFEQPLSVEEARSQVAGMFAPFTPPTEPESGVTATEYSFEVSVVKHVERISMLVAAVPTGQFDEPISVLNEATSWSMALRAGFATCEQVAIALNPEPVDLLFVVDNTFSLADERAAVSDAIDELFRVTDVPSRGISLRVAVVGMTYPDGPVEPQWRTNPTDVVEDLKAIENSSGRGGYGLEVARLATTHHTSTSSNSLKVVIIADREPKSLEETPTFQFQELLDAYDAYFQRFDLYGVLPAIECGEFTSTEFYLEMIRSGRVASSCSFKADVVAQLDEWIGPGNEPPVIGVDFERAPAVLPTVKFWKESVPLERGADWHLMHDNETYEFSADVLRGDARNVVRLTWVRSH